MAYSDEDHNTMSRGNVELQRISARSVSMTIPLNASYENVDTFMSHTGPLRSRMTAKLSPMSDPLHRDQTPGHASLDKHEIHHRKSRAIMPEERDGRYWLDVTDAQRNEHLWNSGPLAVCNDPDCIDCPAAYKTGRGYYRTSGSLETKLHNILFRDAEGWPRRSIALLNSYFPIMNPHTKVVQQWNKIFVISCLVAIFIDPLFFFLLSARREQKCLVFNWSLATAVSVVRSVTDFIYFLHMLLQFRLAYVAPESRVVGAGDLVVQPKKIAMHYLRGYFLFDIFVVLPLPQVMILVVIPKYVGMSSANFAKNLIRFTVLLQYIPRIIRFLPLLAGQSASGFIFESAWANFVINLFMFVLAGHVVGSCWYLFGLQQISTLAGNQVPSYFEWEVLFTMAIVGLGLLLFALLIGNMQNFLLALGRRRLEMQLRRRDVEQWTSHRRLPEEIRRFAATYIF